MSVSAQSTVTVRALGLDSVTVKVSEGFSPASPSATDGLSMESSGVSSSVMVPVASSVSTLPAKCAFEGLDSRRTTVSLPSPSASPVTATATVLLVSFGAKVSVPPAGSA